MDGWSSNNDSYHFGVGCTSITPRKRWRTPQCAMHADFNMTPWGTTYENIICLDCDAPHTTLTVSRAWGKVSNVFTFSAYQIRDKRPSFQAFFYLNLFNTMHMQMLQYVCIDKSKGSTLIIYILSIVMCACKLMINQRCKVPPHKWQVAAVCVHQFHWKQHTVCISDEQSQ